MDLRRFCSHTRIECMLPWSLGEHTYATNGHILIQVPRRPDIPERDDAPCIDKVMDSLCSGPAWTIPPVTPKYRQCGTCEGTGLITTCPECNGVGNVLLSNKYHSYDITCESCDGEGCIPAPKDSSEQQECIDCGGAKKWPVEEPVKVGDTCVFNAHYLQLITDECPNARICTKGELEPATVIFDGSIAVLMPMKP